MTLEELRMRGWFRQAAFVAIASVSLLSAASAAPAASAVDAKTHRFTKPHRLVIQVDQNDPAVMNLALNNAANVIEYYRAKGEDVNLDVVTYGPGLHMLRADTSPVRDRIKGRHGEKGGPPGHCTLRRRRRSVGRRSVDGIAGKGLELSPALNPTRAVKFPSYRPPSNHRPPRTSAVNWSSHAEEMGNTDLHVVPGFCGNFAS
jgi:hypothetical protein